MWSAIAEEGCWDIAGREFSCSWDCLFLECGFASRKRIYAGCARMAMKMKWKTMVQSAGTEES
ncbi:hypothetical protein JCM31598_20040 [Desulfonatronum parangueonense]